MDDITNKAKTGKFKEVTDQVVKDIVLNVAKLSGCDIDGDIIYRGDKTYYVHIFHNIVKELIPDEDHVIEPPNDGIERAWYWRDYSSKYSKFISGIVYAKSIEDAVKLITEAGYEINTRIYPICLDKDTKVHVLFNDDNYQKV